MKSVINDLAKRQIKPEKKIIINRKYNSLMLKSQDFPFQKTNYTKNLKKIIKNRHNSTKEEKNAYKKTYNSKFYFNNKLSSSKEINIQTINTRHIKNSITPPKKTKIKIIKKKEGQHKRNNKSISCLINEGLNKESASTGLSSGTGDKDKELIKNVVDSEENNRKININNFNYNADSHSNKLETILFEDKTNNLNNFCYETISKEDSNDNDNKIILKCDNYSMLTFGNSFSYSNSQKRKSNKKFFKNENNNNSNNIIKKKGNFKDNSYVNKLKEENEFLKKELKESTEQITFLIHQIQDLKDNTYLPIKKNRKKSIPRNIFIKTNKTKESYDIKIKNKLNLISKLNNQVKNNKNNDIKINLKKNQIKNASNIPRKRKSQEKFVDFITKIKY